MSPTAALLEEKLDISVEELMEALSDEAKAEELIAAQGWTRDDLLERAEALTRSLSADISTLNMV
ncbi:hypothetical protein [Streptomyces triticiradicis]|uniref:Uncharacterized protein n=1 Tax=Streptomyces triticiradicis TaxID=2651189 RepID=A0A7J5D3V5_9ACTN|nr:hypothetical protein [Streptomyces triticiradicis]KAB1978643.1 hypothetical protein F8144_38950 [Streptomyces triticiradicis]